MLQIVEETQNKRHKHSKNQESAPDNIIHRGDVFTKPKQMNRICNEIRIKTSFFLMFSLGNNFFFFNVFSWG